MSLLGKDEGRLEMRPQSGRESPMPVENGLEADASLLRELVPETEVNLENADVQLLALAADPFAPGLSTAGRMTDPSGREVGMDMVKKNVDALHGEVEINSVPGRGTSIRIRPPQTPPRVSGENEDAQPAVAREESPWRGASRRPPSYNAGGAE